MYKKEFKTLHKPEINSTESSYKPNIHKKHKNKNKHFIT